MNKLLILSLVLLLNLATVAQSFYERFSANTENQNTILHLLNTNGQISAILYTTDKQSETIERLDLSGQMENRHQFNLTVYGGNAQTYSASINEKSIVLVSNSLNDPNTYELVSDYSSGSILLDYYHQKASRKLQDDDIFSPKAAIETSLLIPDATESPGLFKTIMDFYRLDASQNLTPQQFISNSQDKYFEQYIQLNTDLYGHAASLNWERSLQQQVLMNEAGLLCIEQASYAYSGGAHGMAGLHYLLADSRSGKQLLKTDIFIANREQELIDLLTHKVRLRYAIGANQSLTEAGFFVDEVIPNDNIYATPQGVGFYYNNYEIAPYALGHTNVFFGFDEIIQLLKPGSLIHKLATNGY